jgi:N-acetylglutamate synthase-like GNAT family acetyltransferase
MIKVRKALMGDIPALLPMLRNFADFAGTKHSLYPGDGIAAVKVAWLMTEHVFFVAEKVEIGADDEIVGFIAGLLVEHWMNPELVVLSELLWWVEPEHRGSRAGAMLLRAFTDHGEEHAHQMTMVLERGSPIREETLESRGFHLHERTFLREMAV